MQPVQAGEFAYGIGYIGEYSDNILRVPDNLNPKDEKISSTFLGIAYRENGPALDAHVLARAQNNQYRNDTISDSTVYFADASLLWRILPQGLSWFAVDRHDQTTVNATSPDTPNNRIGINVFYTGPDLSILLGQVNTLVLGLRYGKTTYSDYNEVVPGSNLDSDRYGAVTRWQYAANTATTYSLNYEIEKSKYDDARRGRLHRQDVFVQGDRRQAHASFLLALGATRLERDLPGVEIPESTGHLARLTWTQQLSTGTTAGVRLASEYLDAGTALLSTATSPAPPNGGSPESSAAGNLTVDYFYSKRVEVYYNRSDGNFGLNTVILHRNIDYEVQLLDRKEIGGRLDVTYRLSSLLSSTMYGGHLNVQHLNLARDDGDSDVGLGFTYRLNPKLSATLDGRKSWRYSTNESQEYTDRRILLSLVYASSPLFTPPRR